MSILGNRVLGGASQQRYQIGRSLRFRSSASAYLSRTPASSGNLTTWTWSGWIKRGQLGTQIVFSYLFYNSSGPINNQCQLQFNGSDQLQFSQTTQAGGVIGRLTTTAVYRDPSAWYHIVAVWNTGDATSSNRMKLYVNGVQVTAFGTATYPAQNTTSFWNTNALQTQGAQYDANGQLGFTAGFDGYLAEVNFIDGQALTPSSFGAYDNNGVWQPIKYGGTYGTNGFYLPFSLNTTSTYAGSFNGTAKYLTTPTSANLALGSGDFTIEFWLNQTTQNNVGLVCQDYLSGIDIRTDELGSGRLGFYAGSATYNYGSFSGAGQWHHIAVVRSGSGSNNLKMYVDGVVLAQTTNTTNFTSNQFRIGANLTGSTVATSVTGSISNVRVVKGTAVYTAPFNPPSSPLTNIANTQLLTLQDSTIIDNSSNAFSITNTGTVTTSTSTPFVVNITSDASGNSNNWAANNINYSTSGTTYDSMIDSPTVSASASNYCVWNSLKKTSGVTVSNANLTLTVGASINEGIQGTIGASSGKWYAEVTGGPDSPGVVLVTDAANYPGATANSYGYHSNATKYNNGSSSSYGATFTSSDVIGIALDMDAGTVTFYKNNVSQGTAFTGLVGTFTFCGRPYSATSNWNFGQRPFTYTPPTGFNALNTYNLPPATIPNGSKFMAATTYTGDATSPRSVTNGGNNTLNITFQPDLVWQKQRSGVFNNILVDSVRGGSPGLAVLQSNLTDAEYTTLGVNGGISSIASNGFVITAGSSANTNLNANGSTYVAWQWNAGSGVTSTNTNGTITSLVSVNPTAGFSIVSYTGNGTAGATIGHGLGATPNLMFVKSRSTAGQNWLVYSSVLGGTQCLFLDLTNAATTASTPWNNTAPSSTVFTVGTSAGSNTSGTAYIAYCWSAVTGYSAFGSYTGNGSTDGPFVYTGFRPRWVMIKRSSDTGYWLLKDSSRNGYNQTDPLLYANASDAEYASAGAIDILSNGFKLRATSLESNGSGSTLIYAAFAENPFNNSRAR